MEGFGEWRQARKRGRWMDQQNQTRIVVPPRVTNESVDDVSLDLCWIPLGSRPATNDTRLEYVWEDEVAKVYIHFVIDDMLSVAFFYLHGKDVALVEEQIRNALPTYSLDALKKDLSKWTKPALLIPAISRIAALEPAEDHEITALLKQVAATGDIEVRQAVVTAIGYLEWPSLLELLEQLKNHDPDEVVRADAQLIFAAMAERA